MGKILSLYNKLETKDFQVLYTIYIFRCLDEESLYRLFFNKNKNGEYMNISYTRRKITLYKKIGLICEDRGVSCIVYFLTPKAIDILKYAFNFQDKIYDINKNILKKGFLKASDLRVSRTFIDHQCHLNDFVTKFISRLEDLKTGLKYKYYDEKYVSQYNSIRPDGLLQFLGIDFFLEMDMSTERKEKLAEKWNHYRNFFISNEYSLSERKIVMLFILSKKEIVKNNIFVESNSQKSLERRKEIVIKSIVDNMIDTINPNFEIYVGTKEELLDIIFNKFLACVQNKDTRPIEIKKTLELIQGFNITNAEPLKQYTLGIEYDMYIRKINNNNKIVVENKKIQEFLVDDFSKHPLSVLKKISYLELVNSLLLKKVGRCISYIVIVNSEEDAYRYLSLGSCLTTSNVYLTTLERLKTLPLNKALFIMRKTGTDLLNYYHFENTGLKSEILEKSIDLNNKK